MIDGCDEGHRETPDDGFAHVSLSAREFNGIDAPRCVAGGRVTQFFGFFSGEGRGTRTDQRDCFNVCNLLELT